MYAAAARGLAFLLLVGAVVTSQNIDTKDASVNMSSVTHLVEFVKDAEPFSCWCTTTLQEADAYCPVKIPDLPIYKGLNISCGIQRIHCCLERVVDLEDASVLKTIGNITNEEEISTLMTSFLQILMPRNMQTNPDFGDVNHNIYKDNFLEYLEANSDPSITNGQHFMTDNNYNQLYEENSGSRAQYNDADRIDNDLEFTVYSYAFNIIKNVVGLLLTPETQQIRRSDRNQTFEEKAAAMIVGFLNSTFFTDRNKVNNNANIIIKENNKKQEDKLNGKPDKVKPTQGKNNTKSGLEKFDTFDPYARLGWFSRAVETAIDGSVYIGSAIGSMYMVSMFLSGLINQVWTTCFMCYFAENFDLVPINQPNIIQ